MDSSTSLLNRILTKKRPVWVIILVSLIMLSIPFLMVYLDGTLEEILLNGQFRFFLLPPCLILYIWMVSPIMADLGNQEQRAIRTIVATDDVTFNKLYEEASRVKPFYEVIAFALGVALGLLTASSTDFGERLIWLKAYWFISLALMYGLLFWVILQSIASTRVNNVLLRQPLNLNIMDSKSLEPIGSQALLLALVFVGGITLSLLLTFQLINLSSPYFWITNIVMILITLLIFFLSMRPTHQAMVREKQLTLQPVQQLINKSCQELVEAHQQNLQVSGLASEINALSIYEQRLLQARTWPYNTTMLRTLFFSVLIPLGTVLVRVVVEVIFR
jgi:hypothetical protein